MQRVRRWTIRPSANGSRGCARPTSRIIRPWRRSGDDPRPLAQQAFAGTPPAGLAEFARNPRAADYARFRAEVERRGSGALGPTPSGTARFRATRSRTIARYHLYVQWVATQQLAEAADGTGAAGGGLMLDLPIGVNGAGYDVWRERSSFAPDVAAGAPPDAFWSQGRTGALPHRIRTVRAGPATGTTTRCSDVVPLRRDRAVDHVINCIASAWSRGGARARDGVYVRYRAQEWYALLSTRRTSTGGGGRRGSRRSGNRSPCDASPRDPPDVRRATEAGSGGLRAAGRKRGALNTHDMPTWAGFWRGADVPLRQELGLIDRSQADEILLARRNVREALPLRSPGAGPDRPRRREPASLARGVVGTPGRERRRDHHDLARRSPSEPDPQNVPGTAPGATQLAPTLPVDARGAATTGGHVGARTDRPDPRRRIWRERSPVTRTTTPTS